MQLVISALITAGLTIIFRHLENNGVLNRIGNKFVKQTLIGVVFGLAAIYATEFGGIAVGGASMNARDAAPLCAGIFFGPYAGILAGVIGGVERFLCVNWGGGAFTRLACSIACVLAGLFSAFLWKVVFQSKRPKAIYSIIIGLMCEDVHMFLIFVTNDKKLDVAFSYVKKCSVPMMLATTFALFVAFFAIEFMERGKSMFVRRKHSVLSYLQFGLMIIVIISVVLTAYITFIVQMRIAEKSNASINETNLNSIVSELDVLYDTGEFDSYEQLAVMVCDNKRIAEYGLVYVLDSDYTALNGVYAGENLKSKLEGHESLELYTADFDTGTYYVEYLKSHDIYLVTTMEKEAALYLTYVSLYVTILLEILVFASLYIMITLEMKTIIIDNINEVNQNLEAITAGELDRTVNVRRSMEFELLSDSINSMVDHLKELISEAKNRIAKELEFARSVQLSSLTTEFDLSEDIDVYARTVPAKEVGGDFYDVYMLDDNRIAFLIADVSGKGIPAAMFMMRARTSIKALAQTGLDIGEVFFRVNNRLCHNNTGELFITCWMGILNLTNGEIKYVNAGHNPPLIKRNGEYAYFNSKRNLVLAAMDDYSYKAEVMTIEPGDEIFLYTDGVTEAININEDLFGEARLLENINSVDGLNAEDICGHIFEQVDEYAGEGVEQFDDITMLSLRYLKN